MPALPGAVRRLRIRHHRNESRTGGNRIDDCGIDVAAAQHRHQVAAGSGAMDGRRIRHARHVPFLERDPFDGVELDRRTDRRARHGSRRRSSSCRRGRRCGSRPSRLGEIRRRSLSQTRCGSGLRLKTTTGSRRSGTSRERAMRNVMSASSATSNSRSRTTRLNALFGTATSAKSSGTSERRQRSLPQRACRRVVAEQRPQRDARGDALSRWAASVRLRRRPPSRP